MRVAACAALLAAPLAAAQFVANVQHYGAVGDGRTMNTAAFSAALDDIAQHNGGVLYLPPGEWLTTPFNLTSNTVLLLDACILIASKNFSDWPLIAPLPSYGQGRDHLPNWWERYGPFIGIYHSSNVTLTTNSTGTIHGNGHDWWVAVFDDKTLNSTPGHLIEAAWSTDITIGAPPGSPPRAFTLFDSPFWNVHLAYVDNAWVHDISIFADQLYANTDGVDPDSSSNILIERFEYYGGDDAVAVKSGWDTAGVLYGRPTVNVTVRDMVATTRAACVCIGSEMSGGVENVTAYNITCSQTGTGAYVKSAPGRGGYVRGFTFTDSVLVGVHTAFEASLGYGDHSDNQAQYPTNYSYMPMIDGFTIERVTGYGIGTPGSLLGMANDTISGISLRDVDLGATRAGWQCANVTGTASNVTPAPCSLLQPAGSEGSGAAPKVNVTLYSESLCPDCIHFITGAWADVWAMPDVRAIISWHQVVYGNAKTSGGAITCQHGPVECEMNVLQTCAIAQAAGNASQWQPFIVCLENHGADQKKYAQACAAASRLDWATLDACWKGPEGAQLELAAGAETPSHDFVPWVTLSAKDTTFCVDSNCDNFLSAVCDAYKGAKPANCSAEVLETVAARARAQRGAVSGSCRAQ